MTCKHSKTYHRLNPFNQKVYSYCSYCLKKIGHLKTPTQWELENLPFIDSKEKGTKIRLRELAEKRREFLKKKYEELPTLGIIHKTFTPKIVLRRYPKI